MTTCEIAVHGLVDERLVAAVRWELFVFGEVRDVLAAVRPGRVTVVYEGEVPGVAAWCRVLAEAGFRAEPAVEGRAGPGAAASPFAR